MHTLRPVRQLHAGGRWFHGAPIENVDWDPRGRRLLSASPGAVRLWWAATGELVSSLSGIGGEATASGRFVFLADGRRVAGCVTIDGAPVLRIWDVENGGALVAELAQAGRGALVAVDRTRRLALTCDSAANSVTLVDLESTRVLADLATSEAVGPIPEFVDVLSAAIRPDGARVFLHRRNSVPETPAPIVTEAYQLWDTGSPPALLVTTSPPREAVSATWDAAGKRILVGGDAVLDGETLQPLGRLDQVPGETPRLESDASGDRLVAAFGRIARLYSGEKLTPDPQYVPIAGPAVAFSPEGTRLLSGGDGGILLVNDIATGKPVGEERDLPQAEHFVGGVDRTVSFTRDGRVLAVGMGTGVAFHDGATFEKTRAVEWNQANDDDRKLWRSCDPNATPDGSLSAVYWRYDRSRDGEPHGVLVSGPRGPMLDLVHQLTDARSGPVAVSPDGRLAVSGGTTQTLRVWDLATAADVRGLLSQTPATAVTAVAFSSTGEHVAAGDVRGAVNVWSVHDGSRVGGTAATHGLGSVRAIAFGPHGWIAVGHAGAKRNLRLHDDRQVPIAVFEGHASDVTSLAFHPDGTRLVSAGRDRCVFVWSLPKPD